MIKIGIVIPEGSGTFREDAERLSKKLGIIPVFCYGHFAAAYPVVEQMLSEHSDIKAIISRSVTAMYLRKKYDLPIIDLELSNFDFAKTISDLPDKSGNFIVIQFKPSPFLYDIENISKVCNVNLKTVLLDADNVGDINAVVDSCGCNRVVSSVAVVTEPCRKNGKEIILLNFLPETIERALNRALVMIEQIDIANKRTKSLLHVLNAFSEGFLAIDSYSNVILFNERMRSITNVPACKILGKNIFDIEDEHPFIKQLIESKNDDIVEYKGKKYLVNCPYFANKKLIKKLWCTTSINSIREKSTAYQRDLAQNGFKARYHFDDIISISPVMAGIKEQAKKYAATNSNVLILGDSGTGKEMMAQSIHNESAFREGPFVAINCAALPESLLESELFGYEEGAFTGARRNGKEGLFEISQYGTLFLDEIGSMPLSIQAKLLRVLQEKRFCRIGGTKQIYIENRIICATNNHLTEAVKEGKFREDLFYRIDVLHIMLPSLKERTEDIPYLAKTFLRKKGAERGRLMGITNEQVQRFVKYKWPGNFRQLDAFLERIAVLNKGPVVEDSVLDRLFEEIKSERINSECTQMNYKNNEDTGMYSVSGTLAQIEEQVIRMASEQCESISELSGCLGVSRTTLWRKLKAMGIEGCK